MRRQGAQHKPTKKRIKPSATLMQPAPRRGAELANVSGAPTLPSPSQLQRQASSRGADAVDPRGPMTTPPRYAAAAKVTAVVQLVMQCPLTAEDPSPPSWAERPRQARPSPDHGGRGRSANVHPTVGTGRSVCESLAQSAFASPSDQRLQQRIASYYEASVTNRSLT